MNLSNITNSTNTALLSAVAAVAAAFCRDVEELPSSDKYIGNTDYIDRVPNSEHVVYGTDQHGRPFFAFMAHTHNDPDGDMVVAFKRYTDSDLWVCAHLNIQANSPEEMAAKIIARFASDRKPEHEFETVWTLSV